MVEITSAFNDFEAKSNEDDIILDSSLRQISLILENDGNIRGILYNGYSVDTEKMQNLLDKKIFEKNDSDSIYLKENERIS